MVKILQLLIFLSGFLVYSQPVTLFKQYTGNYDFFMIGNTMNTAPNGTGSACTILTQSSAVLNLPQNIDIIAAYLYWSGSGNLDQADLNVQLNGSPITAERTFLASGPSNLEFFGAFAEVTDFVKASGNITYTLSDFDLSQVIPAYCPTGSNYGGWSIVIIYEDLILPNRIVSLYEGFQIVDRTSQNLSITLNGLNVTNLTNAKVGFLAWEGDENIAVTEELRINGTLIGNPPLNPSHNAFNCTNSFTGANNLWNMDLDYYSIGNYINLGDTTMNVSIRSGQDLIIVNSIAVALSSLIADATVEITSTKVICNSRKVEVDYTVYNNNSTGTLVAKVPIGFYADNVLVGKAETKSSIRINESESGTIILTIPKEISNDFELMAYVDDDGSLNGTVIELDETNNTDTSKVTLIEGPPVNKPTDIVVCDEEEWGYVGFDLTLKNTEVTTEEQYLISYHESENDAEAGGKKIQNYAYYKVKSYSSKTIWVRVLDEQTGCANITSFKITVQKKPFTEVPQPIMLCNYKDNTAAANLSLAHLILERTIMYMEEVELRFYPTRIDAETASNEISNLTTYYPPRFPNIVYIKVIGRTNLWCDNIIEIQLNDCVVPKGISPNGDGLNDGFDIAIFNPIELKIFNRYGMEIFEHGEGYTNQWQGQDKAGRELPTGTYFYIFKTHFDTYIGYVQLMREVKY